MEHYELDSDHLKDLQGYESYGNAVDMMKAIGHEKLATMYLDVNVWGTPDDIIERLRAPHRGARRPRPHVLLPLRRPAVRRRRGKHALVRRDGPPRRQDAYHQRPPLTSKMAPVT